MSWSVNMVGVSAAIAEALPKEAEKHDGQSRLEFEAALPHLLGIIRENFVANQGVSEAVLHLEASGHGHVRDGLQIQRSLRVKLDSFYATLVG